ncbi:MAG: hypothetical protein AUJ72_00060 [Candidatus Omnitrophica bacterium CG1_02_46_14]|nr:MAG: hypothetical protein AUJ72_00060 [Candidatus Omnitrophica bacterium CG1_02_46_14]
MLTLNLLSEKQKHKAKLYKINLLGKQAAVILFAVAVSLAIVFTIARVTLQNSLIKTLETDYQSNHVFSAKINKINILAQFIKEKKNGYYQWSELLADLAARTPDNIKLSSVEINRDKKTVTVRGLAIERNALLKFKNNLDESVLFNKTELPVQNLTEKENINFVISTLLELENLSH